MKRSSASGADAGAEILSYGRSVLQDEARAISGLSALLDTSFVAAVEILLELGRTDGRAVISGIGKAGYIASKFSATLSSVGLSSIFLHPAEAIHGDLGRCRAQDAVFILSNSGETAEILRMLPHLEKRGCKIVALTGSQSSSLAQMSDVVLSIGRLAESGPHGLAPTTSTTVMLALCDALAMTFAAQAGLSPEQFGINHPGGELGRALMPVSEIMRSGDENCVVPQSMSAREVVHRMVITRNRPGAASVIDDEGRLVGIFTDGDLRRWLDKSNDFLDRPVSEVMGRNPRTIDPASFAEEGLRVMERHEIDQVIVIDDQRRPIGLLDIQDVIRPRGRERGNGKRASLIAQR